GCRFWTVATQDSTSTNALRSCGARDAGNLNCGHTAVTVCCDKATLGASCGMTSAGRFLIRSEARAISEMKSAKAARLPESDKTSVRVLRLKRSMYPDESSKTTASAPRAPSEF